MNRQRRKALEKLSEQLDSLGLEIESIKDEEQGAFEGLPESIQFGARGQAFEAAIDALQEAFDSVERARADRTGGIMTRTKCKCVVRKDKKGRETIEVCAACKPEHDERHEAARRSGSHVWKQQQGGKP